MDLGSEPYAKFIEIILCRKLAQIKFLQNVRERFCLRAREAALHKLSYHPMRVRYYCCHMLAIVAYAQPCATSCRLLPPRLL